MDRSNQLSAHLNELKERRLGFNGEFYRRTDHPLGDWLTTDARAQFFRAISEEAPAVVSELRTCGRILYRALADRLYGWPAHARSAHVIWWCDVANYARKGALPEAISLHDMLVKWATTYRLSAPWVYNGALYTLAAWVCYGDQTPNELSYPQQHLWEAEIPRVEALSFGFRGWRILTETRAQYRADVRAVFGALLNRHLNDTELVAESSGLTRSQAMRGSRDESADRHFRYLVRYQVLGRSAIQLSRELRRVSDVPRHKRVKGITGKRPSTSVVASLKKYSALIGLPLRAGDIGRPRSRTDSLKPSR